MAAHCANKGGSVGEGNPRDDTGIKAAQRGESTGGGSTRASAKAVSARGKKPGGGRSWRVRAGRLWEKGGRRGVPTTWRGAARGTWGRMGPGRGVDLGVVVSGNRERRNRGAYGTGDRRMGRPGMKGEWARPKEKFKASNLFLIFLTESNLIHLKRSIPKLENFGIKYDCEGFKVRNNFPYRNFFIFEKDI
jgi:hypothetical protein